MKADQMLRDARATLVAIGERRARGERMRAEAMLELRSCVADAVAAGVSVSEISRLAGVTRQTVYSLLGR